MNTIPANWLIPAGAIVAALVAGLFSFFNLVLSKEQKLSELRQEWINGLREDLASFTAALYAIEYQDRVHRNKQGDQVDYVDLARKIHEPYMKLATSYALIQLRLNPKDEGKAQSELIDALDKARKHFKAMNYNEAINCVPIIQETGQSVLKSEWNRVKKGENTFRWSKRIALIVLLAAVALGGYLAIQTRVDSAASDQSSTEVSSAN